MFLIGLIDRRKRFHPISVSVCTNEREEDYEFIFTAVKEILKKLYDNDWRPDTLMADGAEAITNGFMKAFAYSSTDEFNRLMCWPHVERNVTKNSPLKYREALLADISKLQESHSHEAFHQLYRCFVDKWSAVKDEKSNTVECIKEFLEYFEKEWIVANPGWFEGFYEGDEDVPSSNNALESKNEKVKDIFTMRKQLEMHEFLSTMKHMIRMWSNDELSHAKWRDDLKDIDDSFEYAFHFRSGQPIIKNFNKKKDEFIVCKKEFDSKSNELLFKYKYEKCSLSFDELYSKYDNIRKVTLNRQSWTNSKCTCNYFLKNYFCYHIVAVAVEENLADIPTRCQTAEIAKKKKRGRKPKAINTPFNKDKNEDDTDGDLVEQSNAKKTKLNQPKKRVSKRNQLKRIAGKK